MDGLASWLDHAMLGQLLHSFNPTARRAAARHQDVSSQIEDVHTKSLLFPDLAFTRDHDAMSPTTPASEYPPDCHMQTDLDLEASRDVRILIAQGETAALQPLVLFDSKLDLATDSPRPRHTRAGSKSDIISNHTRTASGPPGRPAGRLPQISSIPESNGRASPSLPTSPMTATFAQYSRARRSSMPTGPRPEESSAQRQKDPDEIVKIALDCMFENVQTTYKGISNKIKIVQRESRPYDSTVCKDTFGKQQFSNISGRISNPQRKLSTLSSSFTAAETVPDISSRQGSATGDDARLEPPRRTVLITRTFSVPWSDEDASAPVESSDSDQATRSPGVPTVVVGAPSSEDVLSPQKPRRMPMRTAPKPPMFAITLVLSLPISGIDSSRPGSRSGTCGRRKGSEALADWTSLASSFDSSTVLDPLFGLESSAASLGSDVDDRVDKVIGQHWDIIVRTLSSIQQAAEGKIVAQLKAATQRGRAPKLLHHSLAHDISLMKAAEQAHTRVVRGIKIIRVRTGQGRWGVWRDEARWLNKWTGDRDRTIFLHNLFTVFLGTHTEWLDIAGPKYYRQQHREQLRLGNSSEPSVPSRTVIIGHDKAAARRLIFLLSAFLPANHQSHGDASPFRPSTAASVRAFSQSPPSHVLLSREESLRRSINRRGKRSTSRRTDSGGRTPQQSSSHSDADDRTETGTVRNTDNNGKSLHSRRGSGDLRSMMKIKLVSTDAEHAARKTSAITSPTLNQSATMPMAHIGFQRKYSSGHDGMRRPDSRDSLASENLMQTLQRSSTGNSTESQSASRWGSIRSIWSMGSRHGSATDYSDIAGNDDEGLGIIGLQHPDIGYNKLQRMVDEVDQERYRPVQADGLNSPAAMPSTAQIRSPELEQSLASATSKPIDVPVRMSVNKQDGVIDVEFPGFSPISSPPLVHQSGSSLDSFGMLQSFVSSSSRATGNAMNVAGWLRAGIHPDFELQSTPPYPNAFDDIKAAMRSESSPADHVVLPDNKAREEWVDVCSTVIADTDHFTIKRLRLQRLVRYMPPPPPPATTPMALPRRGVLPRIVRSQYGNPYAEEQLLQVPTQVTVKEKFVEETITDLDRGLMDALERVIAQSGPSSKTPSAASSRTNSVRGRHNVPHHDDRFDIPEIPQSECKKMVIGALEQIATAVERDRRDARKYGGARLRSLNDDTDSTLREGIMRWFDEVERNKKSIEAQKAEILKEASFLADSHLTERPSVTHA